MDCVLIPESEISCLIEHKISSERKQEVHQARSIRQGHAFNALLPHAEHISLVIHVHGWLQVATICTFILTSYMKMHPLWQLFLLWYNS